VSAKNGLIKEKKKYNQFNIFHILLGKILFVFVLKDFPKFSVLWNFLDGMKGKGARTNIGFNKKYFPHSFGIFFYGCVGCIECAFVGFSRTNAGKYRGKSTFTFTQFSCYSVGSINS
jgi:ssDNA-binding Zn-finger/Zn-ribbon topoisomerase 1